jgi:heat shock protein HslJ
VLAVGRPMKTTLLAWFLFVGASLAACTESDLTREARPTTLAGTAWRVVAINGRPAVRGSEPTAVFGASDVKGSAGCNSYGGQYQYDASSGAIAFRDLGITAMACVEPARNDVEALFTQAINQAASASIDPEGRLVLSGPGGEIVLAVDAVGS